MKHILVIALEYYHSNANTQIIRRICKRLSMSYKISIVTLMPANTTIDSGNGFAEIITLPYHSFNRVLNSARTNLYERIKLFALKIKTTLLNDNLNEKDVHFFIKDIIKTNLEDADLCLSFSNPFVNHICGNILSQQFNIPWIPYYFDPFFSNATLSASKINKRKEKEELYISSAKKVLMTYPINIDYLSYGISFADNIIMTEMPGIRNDLFCDNAHRETRIISCIYVGNLYKDIRDPSLVIKLFSSMPESYQLTFVGSYYGEKMDFDECEKIRFIGSKSENEIHEIYQKSDFLINIGNSILNQMPSKIFEYLSTGIPIINFYKDKKCPTLKYLSGYEFALNIFEEDIETKMNDVIDRINKFCIDKHGVSISFADICQRYTQNTDEAVIDNLCKIIKGELGN